MGLSFDDRTGYVYAAGGPTGSANVFDSATGATVASFQVTTPPGTFVNDVVVTRDAAYFTDSFRPVLYRISLSKGGGLPSADAVEEVPLGGDFQSVPGFNTNGIDATPNGKTLIIVHSSLGALYAVDPTSGDATQVDLGGGTVPSGDGILLAGHSLYVVQNFLNQIAVVQLDPGLSSGEVVRTVPHPEFDIPTTVAGFGASLYAVNARFTTPPTPATAYWIVRLPRASVGP